MSGEATELLKGIADDVREIRGTQLDMAEQIGGLVAGIEAQGRRLDDHIRDCPARLGSSKSPAPKAEEEGKSFSNYARTWGPVVLVAALFLVALGVAIAGGDASAVVSAMKGGQ